MSFIEKAMEKARANEIEQAKQIKKGLLGNKQISKDNSSVVELVHESVVQNEHENVGLVDSVNVETKTNISNIVSINRNKLSEQGYLCFENTNSQLFEEYRIIKRPLVNNVLNAKKNKISRANLILVTSSQPGEGKTFTAINLALSIASERDKKVLLVDADVAKPSISNVLDIKDNKYGLIDYLDGKDLDFSQMMLKTDVAGLSIIPAGSRHGYSTELLASKRMALLADELHSRYSDRIVIFDSPPLLATTQAEVLAGLVGQVVLVIEAERTLQSMVADAIDKLKVCDVVLALLNKATHTIGSNYYSYGQYGR